MKKIVYTFIDTCLLFTSIIYLIFKPKKVYGEHWPQEKFDKTIVLGNGPSLKVDMDMVLEKSLYSEIYALNYFAVTEYFKEIRPEYYVLTDRMFWDQNANSNIKKDNEKLFSCLDKVDWKMNIVCHETGFKKIYERLKDNKNIKVLGVHSVNIKFNNEKINLYALNKNIATPHFINALVMVLWHAIYRRRKDIEIYGADFSMFKEYYIDQKTNELYSSFSHFTKNTEAQNDAVNKYPGEQKKMLHTRMYQQWSGFYQMYLLSRLARINNIKIINYSSNSFLDCFDRPK